MALSNCLGIVKIKESEHARLSKSIQKAYRIENKYGVAYHSPYYRFFTNYGWRRRWSFNNRWRLVSVHKKTTRIDSIGYLVKARAWDRIKGRTSWRNMFIKECPLIPIEFAHQYHSCMEKELDYAHPLMEECINYLHSPDSQSHMEAFLTYSVSRLVETGAAPAFPLFYGAVRTTMREWTKDMTDCQELEEIEEFMGEQSIGTNYKLIEYDDGTMLCSVNHFPVVLLATEKMEEDLYNLSKKSVLGEMDISSMWWQVIFGIYAYQSLLGITHNDLHMSNIMYKKTTKTHLYYRIDDVIYKVPTHGRIWKIIDFGRGTWKNEVLARNSVFNSTGECSHMLFAPRLNGLGKPVVEPHYAVDVMTLAMNLLMDVMDKSETLKASGDYKYYERFILNERGERICYAGEEISFLDHIKIMDHHPGKEFQPKSILQGGIRGVEIVAIEDIEDGEEIWGF